VLAPPNGLAFVEDVPNADPEGADDAANGFGFAAAGAPNALVCCAGAPNADCVELGPNVELVPNAEGC
jgi:hypothetical protein